MIGNQPNRLPDPTTEELVAYLDGELDDHRAKHVEQRLAADAQSRETMRQLQHAWDLLDELPRAEATQRLTATTMTLVAQAAQPPARRRWMPWLAGAAVVALAGCLSFVVISHRLAAPERRFLQDLPVIENVDAYRNIESVEFLRQLQAEALLVEEPDDAV